MFRNPRWECTGLYPTTGPLELDSMKRDSVSLLQLAFREPTYIFACSLQIALYIRPPSSLPGSFPGSIAVGHRGLDLRSVLDQESA